MDPIENLKKQIELADKLVDDIRVCGDAIELAELVLALNAWMANGGFSPWTTSKTEK